MNDLKNCGIADISIYYVARLAMADTDRGARAVDALLGRIAHGIAA